MTEVPPLVMIVNESAESLALLRSTVEESGLHAVTVHQTEMDNDAFLSFVEEHNPTVIVFDVSWPYEEKIERYRTLRRDPRGARAEWLVLSTSRSVVNELTDRDGQVALSKPFDLDDLVETIGRLAGRSGEEATPA